MLRRATRIPVEFGCSLWVDGARYPGSVRNLSATGLFIETGVGPALNASVGLDFDGVRASGDLRLRTRVARRADPAAEAGRSGIGLEIEDAPLEYYAVIADLMRDGADAARAPTLDAEPIDAFRVQLARSDQEWQTRTQTINARTEGEACAQAVASAGPGWRVDRCERV